jgi:hypothetical protein
MTYCAGFEYDIFISYARVDNEPFGAGGRCWIDAFHDALCTGITQHLGVRPALWRDTRLRGNEDFPAEIEDGLAASAIFLPIFSPAYLNSAWCRREFEAFARKADTTAGLWVKNKLRIIKVVKTHVARSVLPAPVANVLGYEFYKMDEATGLAKDFLLMPGGEIAYWTMINDLAQDLARLLKLIAEHTERGLPAAKGVVYLAEATSDVEEERRQLKRELMDRGYQVLPDQLLPPDAGGVQAAMAKYLPQADLYVQLFGRRYGASFESDPRSVPALQYEVFKAYRDRAAGCAGVFWTAPGAEVSDARQKALLTELESALTDDFELLSCPLEDLKSTVLDKLAGDTASHTQSLSSDEDLLRVYVVCDQQDKEGLKALKNHLYDSGIEPLLPSFDHADGAREIRELHQDHLALCDAILVYWGEGDDNWLQAKLSDIRKAPAYRKQQAPLRAKTLLISDPPSDDKLDFRTREAEILRHSGTFSPQVLSPFLSRLGLSR